ncbi:hypothetical protein SPRG_15560 [Saprolegnia parasitica CBS 223.65]|uniref:Uncharacterized protein n=1 Tax=Saprolegnia parasitica (strain CBS 223.65) TaxID=695850 RepID=A0A067BJZ9_SAPPC|nr:hypothetical protein SPRG_15560 [Saprolegnia parasitica CBS 223.65]KDO18769.1 hypothetical protein SPRG_15560 [Saprolegnia parasitica CBS 223.65]|eukprot:XP_012210515.1 hypothetical protein SPRG_15560 [Saprolegnia parasitica CBS 223.65]
MDKKTYGKIASLAATPPPATGCGLLVALSCLASGIAAFMLLVLFFPTSIIVCILLFDLAALVSIAVVGLLLNVSIVAAFGVILTLLDLCVVIPGAFSIGLTVATVTLDMIESAAA